MMNNSYNNNTMTVTNAPLAGRLAKLATLPLGRTRWRYCYFVLLDSELRFYKDEVKYRNFYIYINLPYNHLYMHLAYKLCSKTYSILL